MRFAREASPGEDSPLERGDEPSEVSVSVVIPAHNAGKTLSAQLAALAAQVGAPSFEVIVVANCCSDDTYEIAASASSLGLDVRVANADQSASAAFARNQGVAMAHGGLLLFCDADDQVGPDWVRAMADALDRADLVGGHIVLNLQEVPGWIRRRFLPAAGPILYRFDNRLAYPIGASMGCTRDAFVSVGGFDESFEQAAGEDVDLGIRFQNEGYVVGVAPEATFSYAVRSSIKALLRQRRAYEDAGALLLAREGILPRQTLRGVVREALRVAAWRAVRRHELDPRPHVVDFGCAWYRYRARRRFVDEISKVEPRVDESFFTVPVEVPRIGGLGLSARRDVGKWYVNGGTELLGLEAASTLLPPGGVCVDVGAHVGMYSLLAAKAVGSGGVVHAFEANPAATRMLTRNLERHKLEQCVRVHYHALSAGRGERRFLSYENDLVSGFAPSPYEANAPEAVIQVPEAPLDDFGIPPVDLLKVDVEGLEVEVLDGAVQLLGHSPDAAIICEINPACLEAAGYRWQDLIRRVVTPGRSCWVLEDSADSDYRGGIRSVNDVELWLGGDRRHGWYGNLLAVPRSKEHLVRPWIESRLIRGS